MTHHAIQITSYGPPEVLRWQPQPPVPLAPNDVRLKTLAAPVNHTDLQIRAGAWPVRKAAPFPYVPGVEALGVVSELGSAVSGWALGQTVMTTMQGLGGVRAERPGGYAEFVTVSADALAAVPASIDPLDMAALGLGGVTAYQGLLRLGPLSGRRVLVTGAAGGVGSAAVAVARAMGATVTGLVARDEQVDYVLSLGAQQALLVARGEAPALAADSVDGVLDTVGGALFGPCASALRAGGALSLVGAVGGGDVRFDGWQLIRPVTLTGYSTETLSGPELRQAVDALADWLGSGAIRPPAYVTMPLPDAAQAHERLERGGVSGRVLLVPA